MKSIKLIWWLFASLKSALFLACILCGSTFAQMSQKPLLAPTSTAKPNFMLLLDNSGSMNYRFVPDNYRSTFTTTLTPLQAFISPDANDLYYDPSIRYTPRINPDSSLQPQATEVSARSTTVAWDGRTAANVPAGIFYYENCTALACSQTLGAGYGNPTGTYSNTLTFTLCTTRDTGGICTAVNTFSIPGLTASPTFVTSTYVVKSAARTDCTTYANRCSYEEERRNALNWWQYYSTRLFATATSIGQAFSDSSFVNKFRLGYGRMNQLRASGGVSPDPAGMIKRGVRPFVDDSTLATANQQERTDFYNWIYSQTGFNGTPSRQLLNAVGQYYLDSTDTGPWAARPVIGGDNSAHLSCRRSAAVMFSDGAYNDNNQVSVPNVDGGVYTGIINTTHTDPKTSLTFVYSTTPSSTATYVSYPDAVTNTMSDIAMRYWIQDLRPDLADTIAPVSGNPAFWQHMVFYSIGYGIKGTVSENDITKYGESFLSGNTASIAWGDPTLGDANSVINDYVHSGYSGRGKSYSVTTAQQVRKAFNDVISRTINQSGSDAGVAASDTNNSLNLLAGELKYVPSYSVLEGEGDIVAYKLDAKGNVVNPNAPEWFASRKIPVFSARNLVSMSDSGPISLSTTFSSLPADIQTSLGAGADQSFLDYIRGKRTGIDSTTNSSFRIRPTLFGTVVNSPPIFVRGIVNMGYDPQTAPKSDVPGSLTYSKFREHKSKNSLGVMFVPSNDGMLHILNPQTGDEIMGYIPRSVMPKLKAFATEPYDHSYILDGPVNEGDIYDASATPSTWKSIVFGSGGRGGKFIYALSVPVNSTTPTGPLTAPIMNQSNLLWEISSEKSGFANLGNITNPIQSGYLPSEKWVAVFGNGHNSASGVASLFIVNALTGELLQEISTGVGSITSPNALNGVTLVRDERRRIIGAFAGDKFGNMWKFDLRSVNVGGGKLAFSNGQPFFKSPTGQPFSGAPAWRPHKDGILLVSATGQLIDTNDPGTTQTQTIYGVFDKTPFGKDEDTAKFTAPADMTNLELQTTSTAISASNSFASFYKVSTNPVDSSSKAGWRLNMSYEAGQRSISDVLNLNLTVLIATVVPPVPPTTEVCTASNLSSGYLYQLDAVTGGNPDVGSNKGRSGFDVNGDSVGDGVGVAKADGFPRNNSVSADYIGPRTEWFVKDNQTPDPTACAATSESGIILGANNNGLGLSSTQTCGFQRVWQQLLNPPKIP